MIEQSIKKISYLGSFSLISNIFQRGLGFLLLPIYTSYLSPEDFGIIGLLFALVGWIQRIASAPVGNGITRQYHAPENNHKQPEMVFSGFIYVASQLVVFVLLYLFFNNQISNLLFGSGGYSRITRLFVAVLLLQPLGGMGLMGSLLRIQGKVKYLALGNAIRFLLSALIQLYFLIFQGAGVFSMIYGLIAGNLFDLCFLGIKVFPFLKYHFSWKLLKPVLHYGYPLLISALSLVTLSFLDKYFLRRFDNLDAVGLYVFAFQISSIVIVLFSTPLKEAFLPVVFKMEKNNVQQKELIKKGTTYFYLLGLIFSLLIAVCSPELLKIIARKPAFWDCWPIISILAFVNVHVGVASFFGNGLAMAKKSFLISVISVIKLCAGVFFLFLLVPHYGGIGAACALLIAELIQNILNAWFSNRYNGNTFEAGRLIFLSLLFCIVYLLIQFLFTFDYQIVYNLIVKTFLTCVLFIMTLWFFFFKKKEKEIIVQILKRRRT